MPITELAPHAALLVVDVQSGTLPNARAVPADQLVERITTLAAAFRASGRLVVFAVSTGTPPGRTEYASSGLTWPDGFSALDLRLGRTEEEPLLADRDGAPSPAPGSRRSSATVVRERS